MRVFSLQAILQKILNSADLDKTHIVKIVLIFEVFCHTFLYIFMPFDFLKWDFDVLLKPCKRHNDRI